MGRILVVDDESTMRFLLRMVFEIEGLREQASTTTPALMDAEEERCT